MLLLIVAVCWSLLLLWICRARTALLAACALLLFSLTWRVMSAAYIWSAGPVFAEELNRTIGPGGAPALIIAVMLTVAPMAWMWRPSATAALLSRDGPSALEGRLTLGDLGFAVGLLGVFALYQELFSSGVIPLLDCVERTDYARLYGGRLNSFLLEHGPLVALNLGVLAFYPRLRGRNIDIRHGGLLLLLLLYGFVTGHRFSLFLVFCCFFMMPAAALLLAHRAGILPAVTAPGGRSAIGNGRRALLVLLASVTLLGALGLGNSYLRVRQGCSPTAPVAKPQMPDLHDKLTQRIGVQQSQMWFPSWERVVMSGQWQPARAWSPMFVAPLVPERNSGIQYLMRAELGDAKSLEMLKRGHQYASGHAEVLLELLGPWLLWPALIAYGAVLGWLLRTWTVAVWKGHFLTAFTGGYVFYAVALLLLGGMPNFLVAWTFWVKVGLFVLSLRLEGSMRLHGLPLIPYELVPLHRTEGRN